MTPSTARTGTSRFLAVVLFGAFALFPTAAASAHSELVESTPADGAQLSQAPSQVQLVFDEAVQQQGGSIVVSVRDTILSEDATFATDGNTATVQLTGPGQPGGYTVKYRIVSADGQIATGTFGYSVTGTTPPSTSADATKTPVDPTSDVANSTNSDESGDSNGTVVWVLGLGAIGIVLVIAVISVAVRGRRDRSD